MKNKTPKGRTFFGTTLPPLPVSMTGNFPASTDLDDLRHKVAKGFQTKEELERRVRIATETCLRDQMRLGIDVLTDGEIGRADRIGYFANKISGYEAGGEVRVYGNFYFSKPIIKSKLAWKNSMSVESWQYAQRTSGKPLKAVVTAPYSMLDWSFNEYYRTREEALDDLTAIIRKEVVALSEAGAQIIQLDEPSLSSRPEEFSLIAASLKKITADVKSYFILHHAYGTIDASLWQKIERLPVQQLSLMKSCAPSDFLRFLKKYPTDKDIAVGLISSLSSDVELPRQMEKEIKSFLPLIAPTKLWLTVEDGLKYCTQVSAGAKLNALITTAKKIRDQI